MLAGFERVLVTGGSGFIGSHLAEKLVQLGKDVTIFDNLSTGRVGNNPKGARFVRGDIRDLESLEGALRNVDLVFHEAANASTPKSVEDPKYDFDVNVLGTFNVLSAAVNCDVKRLVYASSAAVYGDPKHLPVDENHVTEPTNPYGVSKLAGERYCKAFHDVYGINTVSTRTFNVYGPRENLETTLDEVVIYLNKVRHNEPITILGDGNQTRDFVYVKDVVEAKLLAAEKARGVGEVFNVGTGVETSINELTKTIMSLTKREVPISHVSPRKGDIYRSFGDISKARKLLGYEPRFGLEQGLQELIKSS